MYAGPRRGRRSAGDPQQKRPSGRFALGSRGDRARVEPERAGSAARAGDRWGADALDPHPSGVAEWVGPLARPRDAPDDPAASVGEEPLRPRARRLREGAHQPAAHRVGARCVRRLLPPRGRGLHPQRHRRRRRRPHPPGQTVPADCVRLRVPDPAREGDGGRAGPRRAHPRVARPAPRRQRRLDPELRGRRAPTREPVLLRGLRLHHRELALFVPAQEDRLGRRALPERDVRDPRARGRLRDPHPRLGLLRSPAPRSSRCSSASASAGTSSRGRTPASSAPPSRRTRRAR